MKRVFLTFFIIYAHQALACGEITPNEQVTKIVTRLAYSDFPQASDIFAIIRTESSFNANAKNVNERESSIGLMQVQNGSLNPRVNIAQGVAKLREYYKLTGSIKGAVESYNIGPRNYLRKKLTISGEAYYRKFLLQKKVYADWPDGEIVSLGKHLGCGKENGVPKWIQEALVKNAPDEVVEAARVKINGKRKTHAH